MHDQHSHHHAGACGGLDHHSGEYTPRQRADLDRVLALNDRIAAAIDAGVDTTRTLEHLDPDPLRYMWVDEGQGRIAEDVAAAHRLLDDAPPLPGHGRVATVAVDGARSASRPTVAVGGPRGTRVTAWMEWVPAEGEVVRARVDDGALATLGTGVADVVRPRAAVTADGAAWVVWGSRRLQDPADPGPDHGEGAVVLAARWADGAWSAPEQVSLGDPPSFNAEVAAHADGSLELVWQGRVGGRFGVHARRHTRGGGWGRVILVTEGVTDNVWDPTVVATPEGGAAYAWSQYRAGAYRVVVRRRDAGGALGAPLPVTSGRDYALHPNLAVTTDGQLWCAFDVVTVHAHGGSGPTRLRPAAELGADPSAVAGVRPPGHSVPPELIPEVAASIRVVAVGDDGVRRPAGELAPHLDVVPSGLPQLVATADGGLSVAYRTHRRLPLMTYYWEVAVQALGPEGWLPPTTLRETDGTLEEPAVAALGVGTGVDGAGVDGAGLLVAAQTDARLARALQWTEGFGGRECPYLLEHHGSVIWHGIHGIGAIATATLPAGGPVPAADALAGSTALEATVHADDRREARRWAEAAPDRSPDGTAERYTAEVGGDRWQLYWGDLHRHSLVSRCTAGDEPTLEDFYRYAWDVCEYDFWAVTDHAENSSEHQWWSLQKTADLLHVPGRFVPLYGFEWTSADTGHQNVIFGDVARGAPIFSAFAEGTTTPRGLWDALAEHPAYPAVTIPHHPGAAMVRNDWGYLDERYGRLVEVFQACRGSYEGDGSFRQYADGTREGTFVIDGLRRGAKIGLIASSDHGHGASYVGAFAASLSRADVFGALHARRVFAATTRDLVIDLRAGADGEVFMGEDAPDGTTPRLVVHAEGYADLARVDLVRDGDVVHEVVPDVLAACPDGWLRVAVRVEWGAAPGSQRWDGALSIRGGEVLACPFWSPDVVTADATGVAWRATTHHFGDPYGAQRGAVEVTLLGPPGAEVTVSFEGAAEPGTVSLGELAKTLDDDPTGLVGQALPAPAGHARLQRSVGGLTSLGGPTADLVWEDEPDGAAHFYYARAVQTDGEMAWSSPIWLPAPGA